MKELADGLWAAEKDFRLPGGIVFRSRMTAIDLGDGELLLHSPVELDAEEISELGEVGEVRWIVSPNDFHDSDLEWAAAQFPQAKIAAPPNVRKAHSSLEYAVGLEEGASWRGLDTVSLGGTPRWNETVLIHHSSRTLICGDLVFNITEPPNFMTSLLMRMVGCHRCFAQSRSVKYLLVRDRDRFAESISELMQHDFDRVVMCHGDVVQSGGRSLLEREVGWVWSPQRAMLEA